MRKKLKKLICILMILALISTSGAFATTNDAKLILSNLEFVLLETSETIEIESEYDYYEYDELDCVEHIYELTTKEVLDLANIFNIYYTQNAPYAGYIFRLVENAIVPFIENANIGIIHAASNLFVANTLEDIASFIDPVYILYIEPDYIIHLDPMPTTTDDFPAFSPFAFAPTNDPVYYRQWNIEKIRGAAAWSTSPAISTSGVVVAVIDSGIHRNHLDLNSANIRSGRNFIVTLCNYCGEDECDDCTLNRTRPVTDTSDDCGHGTAVTGIIAAVRNNDEGIASMSCGVTILPLRVFVGTSQWGRGSAVASAIHYAIDNGANIINLSLGSPSISTTMRDAIDRGRTGINPITGNPYNVWMIAAAGNDGANADVTIATRPFYPAAFDNVINVGAIARNGVRFYASQRYSNVFIMAPGDNNPTLSRAGGIVNRSYTSLAAPHILSLAAVARAHSPDMTQTQFENLLRRSAVPRYTQSVVNNTHSYGINNTQQLLRTIVTPRTPARNNYYGYGIIDVGLFMYNLMSETQSNNRDFFNFTDVSATNWARGYILENARYGIMHGRYIVDYAYAVREHQGNLGHNSQNRFSPGAYMWRLEFPMALGRLHELNGRNIMWHNAAFPDVRHSVLFPYNYSRYVNWASTTTFAPGQHIVRGIVNNDTEVTEFLPGGNVTRAEAAAMFYRYAHFLALTCETAERLNEEIQTNINAYASARAFLIASFPDADTSGIADWAVNYMAWAVGAGMIEGRSFAGEDRPRLAAGGSITRAEGAAMFARYRRIFLRGTFLLNQHDGGGSPSGGNQVANAFSWAHFNLGAIAGDPTFAITAEIPVGENISRFLSWFMEGSLQNNSIIDNYKLMGWYFDASFTMP